MSNQSRREQSTRSWFANLAASSRPAFSRPWSLLQTSSAAKTPNPSQSQRKTQTKSPLPSRPSSTTQPKETARKPSQTESSSSLSPPPKSLDSSPPVSSKIPTSPQSPSTTQAKAPSPSRPSLRTQPKLTAKKPSQIAALSPSASPSPSSSSSSSSSSSPSHSPSPSPTSSPSSSRKPSRLQSAAQTTNEQPSPPLRKPSKSPKPSPVRTLVSSRSPSPTQSIMQAEQAGTQEVPQIQPQPSQLTSQPQSTTKKPIEQMYEDKWFPVLESPPQVVALQPQDQEQSLIQKASQPNEGQNQFNEDLESKQVPGQDLISRSQSEEGKPVEDPGSKQDIQLSQLPENKDPQRDTEPKQNLLPSQPPQIKKNHETDAALEEEIKHLNVPQAEEKPEQTNAEIPKSDMVVKHEINPSNQELEKLSEDDQKEIKKAAEETQEEGKSTIIPNEELKEKLELVVKNEINKSSQETEKMSEDDQKEMKKEAEETQEEGKPTIMPHEELEPVVKHEINKSSQELEKLSEDDQKEMKKDEEETQGEGKLDIIPNEELRKKIEPELPLADHNSKPINLHQNESVSSTELLNTQKHSQEKSSKGMKRTSMEASSTMRASSSAHSEQASLQKEIKESISRLIKKLNIEQLESKQATSIITLAGKNEGASMFIGHETVNKENSVPLHQHHTVDENEESQRERLNLITDENAVAARINSNVQSINNSMLYEGYCVQGDSGVHLMLFRKPGKHIQLRGGNEPESVETLKSVGSTTPP